MNGELDWLRQEWDDKNVNKSGKETVLGLACQTNDWSVTLYWFIYYSPPFRVSVPLLIPGTCSCYDSWFFTCQLVHTSLINHWFDMPVQVLFLCLTYSHSCHPDGRIWKKISVLLNIGRTPRRLKGSYIKLQWGQQCCVVLYFGPHARKKT